MTEEVLNTPGEETGAQPEAVQEPAAPAWSDEDASEARLFGWKDPQEWQGEKPAGYIDNPTEYLGMVKRSKTFSAMQTKLEEQARESAETNRKLGSVYDQVMQREREGFQAKLAEITAQQRAAVSRQDTQAFDQLEQSKVQLVQQQQQRPAPPAPEVDEYRAANDWTKNPLLWSEAVQAVNIGLQSGQISSGAPKDQIAYAEGVMRQKYPHMFKAAEAPKPAAPRATVEGGGIAGGQRDAFSALPADARAAFKKFVSDGLFQDDAAGRKAYLEMYNG